MPRIYYDKYGNYRGGSMSGKEWLFWNNSFIGLIVWAVLAIAFFPFWLTYRIGISKLEPAAKVLLIVAFWGAVLLAGALGLGKSSASQGSVSQPPAWVDPSSIEWDNTPCRADGGIQNVTPMQLVDPAVPGVYYFDVRCNDQYRIIGSVGTLKPAQSPSGYPGGGLWPSS